MASKRDQLRKLRESRAQQSIEEMSSPAEDKLKELEAQEEKTENLPLPKIDYGEIAGLRLEARQKLNKFSPATLGQAKRIDGVSPADINVLLVYLKLKNYI